MNEFCNRFPWIVLLFGFWDRINKKNSLVEQAAWDEDFELCFIIIFMVRGRDFSKKNFGVYRPFKQVSSASMKCWSQTQYNKKEKRKYFPSSNGIVCWGKFG